MEKLHRDILEELRDKIVIDLDVNNIIIQLKSERVLRNEEVSEISLGQTKQRRAQILLDILPSCGPHAFDVFHQALRHHYFWLSDDIDNILTRRMIDVNDMGRSSPGSPNLPPQSPMTVTRETKMNQLKLALTNLVPGGYLALHGMKGFGKSCLTANTLKDASLVRNLFTMKDGFTKVESLGLFAKSLGTDVDKLPTEAQMIHEECNGMPILIATFAAHFKEFKDEMNTSPQKWKYYLKSLQNKDSSNRLVNKFLAKQDVIFDMCIGKLDADIKSKYEALAIFSEDVNIMPQTLEILWDLDPLTDPDASHKVADDMILLCHKSLAAKHWNVDLKSYVYGVHDLLLCHLRRKLTPKKLRDMHRSFIEKYRKYCKGDFSKLPNDNYSYSYIGHHLEQSGLYDEFPKLYLDFDFIRNKIYHTGLSDMLIDLKKYRRWITENTEEGEAKIRDLETFLEDQAGIIAEHRRRECLDLVQIAINHSSTEYVNQKAREIATTQQSNLYVIYNNVFTPVHNNIPTSEEVSTDIRTAFFTDNPDKILIGNHSGEVVLWDCETRGQTVFSGHNKKTAIIKIIVSSEEYFFTLSEDGRVKLFVMREGEQSNGLVSTPMRVRSPREKQPFWSGIFSSTDSKDNSTVTISINGEKITDMVLSDNDMGRKRIAVCTEQGTIQVLSLEGKDIYTGSAKGHSLERVAFTRKGSMLHLLNSEGALIFYAEQDDDSYRYLATYNPNLLNRKVIFFQAIPENERSLMIVADIIAIHVKWEEPRDPLYPNLVGQVHSFIKQERAKIEENEAAFTCATLTYDGQYLITADSKGSINVWVVVAGTQPIATFKGRVNSLDTYWFDDAGYHLICGSEDRVIHKWTLFLEQLPSPKSVRKPLFDAVMKPRGEADIVAKETGNGIVVYNGDTMVTQTELVEGTIVRLSVNSDGNKIVYATDRGVVALFDLKIKTSTLMPSKLATTPSIVTFVTVNDSTVVACGENSDLKIWFHNIIALVNETGYVLSIYTIGNEHAITVGRNGAINFWKVTVPSNWMYVNLLKSCEEDESLCSSCLSPNKKMLAVLKTNGGMLIYEIIKDDMSALIDTDVIVNFSFDQKVNCCEYSQDDNYLAIGLENGDISIFDILGPYEICRLQLHCNEVRQLHWGPVSLGAPILLSVNCDELAWWNVAPLLSQKKENRRRRMGMSRSTSNIGSSPGSSGRLSVSQSFDFKRSDAILGEVKPSNDNSSTEKESLKPDNNVNENCFHYWKKKSAKHKNRKALLSVVPLPPSCNSKVCVSDDFRKFLSVDIHGFVRNFRLYNDT